MRHRTGVSALVLLLTAVSPVRAADLRASLDLDASGLRSTLVEGHVVYAWDGSSTLRHAGQLELPSQMLTFVVQPGQTITAIRLEGGRVVRVGDAMGLRPVTAEPGEDGRLARAPAAFDDATLGRSAAYPPVEGRVTGTHVVHGRHLVTVEVFPLRIGGDGALWLWENARVVAETGPTSFTPQIVRRERDPGGWATQEFRTLLGVVANPQDVEPLALPLERSDGPPASAAMGPSVDSAPVRHLILTNQAMAAAFQRLADHRTRLGLPSLVVTIDEVLATTRRGADLAETIRNYVQDAYAKWGVDYLLIGGDTEILPTRYARSTFYPSGGFTDIPTDHYFGGLDGNWNADGDDIFGEPFRSSADPGDFVDYGPEVSVGRAPVTTAAEANAFVDKILAYEIPATTNWQQNFMIASEVLFPLGWKPPDPVQYDGATPSEELVNDFLQPCSDPDWGVTRYYERPDVYPGSMQVSVANVVSALNSKQFGIFHHIGHGFYFSMSVGDASLSPAEVDGLTNAPNYFLLYSLNCSSSAFDFNCLNERFVRNPNGGAVASIGSSRSAFPSGSEPLQEAFYQQWLCGGSPRIGDVVNVTRFQFLGGAQVIGVTQWTQLIYTLIGDPATLLWSAPPRLAALSGPPAIALGSSIANFTVTAAPSGGIEGVTVTITKDGESWATGITGPSGTVAIPFRAETTGTATAWISGGGVRPASLVMPVTDPNAATPSIVSFAIDDDASAPSAGNGNGHAEAGETIALTPTLLNGSQTAFTGGTATLRTDDPWVTVLDSLVTLPPIPGGTTVVAAQSYVLALDPDAPDGHTVELRVVLPGGVGPANVDREYLVVGAPGLEVVSVRFLDFGDGDGIPTTNEEIGLRVRVKNYGTGAAEGLVGSLAVLQGAVTLLDGATTWPASAGVLSEVENTADELRIRVDGDPALVQLQLTLQDGAGRTFAHVFDLVRPSQVTGLRLVTAGPDEIQIAWQRPSVADLYGYRVYRSVDGGPESVASADVIRDIATFRDADLAALTEFTYRVAAVDQGGVEGLPSAPFLASTTLPELECFPLPLGLETSGALAIGHVDADGRPDMVIGADLVYVIDGDCKEKLDGDNDAQTFGPVIATKGRYGPNAIVLAELDGKAGMEIITVERDTKRVFVFDAQGNTLPGWPVTLSNWAWSTAAVGDLDGDGDLEIVVNDLSGYTYAFHHDGSQVADGDNNPATFGVVAPRRVSNGVFESFGRTSPALFDVDGDGKVEILFGSKFQNGSAPDYFYALKGDGSGANAAGWPKVFAPQSAFLASPTVADFDGDGIVEIIAPSENDSLYVWKANGQRQPGFPIRLRNDSINADSLTPSPALGDFDGDGELEIVAVAVFREVVGSSNIWRSYVYVIDQDGSVLPGWPQIVNDLSESSPVVGDIDGDGHLDIVYGIGGSAADDYLFAWNRHGQMIRGFPIPIAGFVRATPTLTDFDLNGTLDIALATWDRLIHVWDTGAPYDPALVPWPTFRGNVNRTGVFGQHVVTSADAPSTPVRSGAIASIVPNPFNPQTVIRFEVGATSQRVRLDLYDLHGRRVRSLVDRVMPSGVHDARWDGTDQAGLPVATGVYFAVLEVDGGRAAARKLTLLK